MNEQKKLITLINNSLSGLSYPATPKGLFEPIRYILALGGKRIRPVLTLMATELWNGDIHTALQPALGIEVFHNFTLLHDDLMDNADKRRNQPTVHKKWDANTAILSGDAMQIIAYQLMTQTPTNYLKKVLELFSQTALEICEGQQYDMDFERRSLVTEDEYLEMIRLKTAVLLGCALKTGAIIAGASDADANNLYTFGENIGLAFQLKDDLLDVYADTAKFGKNIGGDILNNKKTFLLITALKNATPEQKLLLESWLNRTHYNPTEKIEVFTALYNDTGAKDICEQKMEDYFQKGIAAFDLISVSEEKKAILRTLAEDLMYRES